jgi:hypothetical protein
VSRRPPDPARSCLDWPSRPCRVADYAWQRNTASPLHDSGDSDSWNSRVMSGSGLGSQGARLAHQGRARLSHFGRHRRPNRCSADAHLSSACSSEEQSFTECSRTSLSYTTYLDLKRSCAAMRAAFTHGARRAACASVGCARRGGLG